MLLVPSHTEGPLNLLELAIGKCLETGIAELLWTEKIKENPFKDIRVIVTSNSIRIQCICSPEWEKSFQEIVDDCFVCRIISLEKKITFKREGQG